MTFKESIFFIAKCLTISSNKKNRQDLQLKLEEGKIIWDEIVKISSSHLVLPAVYCKLKKHKFLKFLPKDLVNYMKQITTMNYKRNKQIIKQAIEINNLLLKNKIKPIFIKGTCNIIEGLYEDISERMISDIDFLCSKDDYPKAINLLIKNGYKTFNNTNKSNPPDFKHYPRLVKSDRIAAVEIHKEMINERFSKEFNYSSIKDEIQKIDNFYFLGFKDQFNLTILARQINDDGFIYKEINLKTAYDVLLLSKKIDCKKASLNFNELFEPINCFLALCYTTFSKIKSLEYNETKKTKKYLNEYNFLLNNENERNYSRKSKGREIYRRKKIRLIYKSIFFKDYRNWLIKKIFDKEWRKKIIKNYILKKN